MKRFLVFCGLLAVSICAFFAEGSANQKKFIRGNIAEKTAAVKESDGSEAVLLSKAAIQFCMDNKEVLGEDRDLAALCVAGVLSIPTKYIVDAEENERQWFFDSFYKIYRTYADTTVEIAVLNKISSFEVSNSMFTSLLNDYLKSRMPASEDVALLKTIISTLGKIGNDDSFFVLQNLSSDPSWKEFQSVIEASQVELSVKAMDAILALVRDADAEKCRNILNLVQKNTKSSNAFKATIAENVLARTIYIAESTNSYDAELVTLQLDAYKILVDLNWTRSSETVVRFYEKSKTKYESKEVTEEQFVQVVLGLKNTVPLKAVSLLCEHLSQLNKMMEQNEQSVSENLVFSIIQTLGAIGDKNAFDSLLAVTYYNYSDTVISSARDALARLKW